MDIAEAVAIYKEKALMLPVPSNYEEYKAALALLEGNQEFLEARTFLEKELENHSTDPAFKWFQRGMITVAEAIERIYF